MTESQLSRLLGHSTVEPIAPEFDPVWDEAAAFLRSSAIEPEEDSAATARILRAVRHDRYDRSPRNWVPFVVIGLASALAFFAVAEAVVPHASRPAAVNFDLRR